MNESESLFKFYITAKFLAIIASLAIVGGSYLYEAYFMTPEEGYIQLDRCPSHLSEVSYDT